MSKKNTLFLLLLSFSLTRCNYFTERKLKKLSGQENAVWTQGLFLRGYNIRTKAPLTDEQIRNYATTLKEHHIKYAYLFAGPFDSTGHLPAYPFTATAVRSVALIKKYDPELTILPWIGGVQNKQLYLGDSSWVRNALHDAKKLINTLNVPGVHVDLEYIMKGESALDSTTRPEKPGDYESYGRNVNEFHRKLRQLLPKAFISSVVVSTSPGTKQWKRKTTIPELHVLTQYIDQLTFLFYDTRIRDQQTFDKNCADLMKDMQSLSQRRKILYNIGVGTFINEPALRKYRDLDIENMPNTLVTISNQNLALDPPHKIVSGISIACDWTTTPEAWDMFNEYWGRYN